MKENNFDGTYFDCYSGKCYVRMYQEPTRRESTVDTESEPITLVKFSSFSNNKIYLLGYVKIPFNIDILNSKEGRTLFSLIKENIRKEIDVIKVTFIDLDISDYVEEIVFRQSVKEFSSVVNGKMRIIKTKGYVYFLMIGKAGTLSQYDIIELDTWLDSFGMM